MEKRSLFRSIAIALPFLWLACLFLMPFLIVFKISLSDDAVAQQAADFGFEFQIFRHPAASAHDLEADVLLKTF